MTSPPLGLIVMANTYGFISDSISYVRIKFGRMVNQHALSFASKFEKEDKLYLYSMWDKTTFTIEVLQLKVSFQKKNPVNFSFRLKLHVCFKFRYICFWNRGIILSFC